MLQLLGNFFFSCQLLLVLQQPCMFSSHFSLLLLELLAQFLLQLLCSFLLSC